MTKGQDIDLDGISNYVSENRLRIVDGWIRRYAGEIFLNVGEEQIPKAEYWIKEAIACDESNRMMFHLGRDYALYAEFFKRQGDELKARKYLTKAIEVLKECSAVGWVEKYEEKAAVLA
jgi:hypothetical protein